VKIPGHPARKNSIFKIKKLLKRFVWNLFMTGVCKNGKILQITAK
jgi:hypothetical protein